MTPNQATRCVTVIRRDRGLYEFYSRATRLYDPLCPSVGRSERVSFFQRLPVVFALLLLPNCLNSLFYHCPCPSARDFGSRVYGLVLERARIAYMCFFKEAIDMYTDGRTDPMIEMR